MPCPLVRSAIGLLAVSLVAAATGCGGGSGGSDGGAPPPAVTLQSIEVSPAAPSIANGRTQPFTATGHYSDGTTADLTASATWSANAAVATFAANVATAVAVGSTGVTATYGGKVGTAMLTVMPAVLDRIDVTPLTASVAKGQTLPFTALGTYSDASTQDLTTTAIWTANATYATVSAAGVATGVGVGTTAVRATVGTVWGEGSLTVDPAVLTGIEVDPPSTAVAVAGTVAFTATGRFSDGTGQPYTALVTWASSSGAASVVATGVGAGVATGLDAAVDGGVTTISATYGLLAGSARLQVTAAALDRIDVSPATASVAKGRAQQFTATAVYVGGATEPVTDVVVWGADPLVASVDASGLATAVDVGNTAVTATWGGKTGSASLDVTAALLTAVTVSPPASSVALGFDEQFTAYAVYSDGAKLDVSALATWGATPGTVASIDGSGFATSLATGAADVTATYDGVTGSAALTVTNAILQSVTVTPADPIIPVGVTQQFEATGVFSDSSRLDLTSQVTWSSSNTAVATVSADGLATPVPPRNAEATLTITALHAASGKSGQTTLTVTPATLLSISVTPAAATIAAGTSEQFTATGLYDDDSTQDLTALVTWSSSDPSVTISSDPGSEGLATGVAAGSAQVTATLGTLSDVSALTVTAATLESITITPADAALPVGVTQQLTATGNFSDGSTQDLTHSVAWVTLDPGTVWISNDPGGEGLATALAIGGPVTVEATYASVTGTTTVTVSDATVVSIQVTPATATLPKGFKLQLTATALYSDSSELDVTADATWSSLSPTVATVSNALGTQGLATGVGAGTATVRATLGGVTGSSLITVTTTTLRSIAISPSPFTVSVTGEPVQLTAIGTFGTGGSAMTLDVTTQVAWSVSRSTPRKAAIVSKTGLVTGLKAGTVTLKASKGAVKSTASGTVIP